MSSTARDWPMRKLLKEFVAMDHDLDGRVLYSDIDAYAKSRGKGAGYVKLWIRKNDELHKGIITADELAYFDDIPSLTPYVKRRYTSGCEICAYSSTDWERNGLLKIKLKVKLIKTNLDKSKKEKALYYIERSYIPAKPDESLKATAEVLSRQFSENWKYAQDSKLPDDDVLSHIKVKFPIENGEILFYSLNKCIFYKSNLDDPTLNVVLRTIDKLPRQTETEEAFINRLADSVQYVGSDSIKRFCIMDASYNPTLKAVARMIDKPLKEATKNEGEAFVKRLADALNSAKQDGLKTLLINLQDPTLVEILRTMDQLPRDAESEDVYLSRLAVALESASEHGLNALNGWKHDIPFSSYEKFEKFIRNQFAFIVFSLNGGNSKAVVYCSKTKQGSVGVSDKTPIILDSSLDGTELEKDIYAKIVRCYDSENAGESAGKVADELCRETGRNWVVAGGSRTYNCVEEYLSFGIADGQYDVTGDAELLLISEPVILKDNVPDYIRSGILERANDSEVDWTDDMKHNLEMIVRETNNTNYDRRLTFHKNWKFREVGKTFTEKESNELNEYLLMTLDGGKSNFLMYHEEPDGPQFFYLEGEKEIQDALIQALKDDESNANKTLDTKQRLQNIADTVTAKSRFDRKWVYSRHKNYSHQLLEDERCATFTLFGANEKYVLRCSPRSPRYTEELIGDIEDLIEEYSGLESLDSQYRAVVADLHSRFGIEFSYEIKYKDRKAIGVVVCRVYDDKKYTFSTENPQTTQEES